MKKLIKALLLLLLALAVLVLGGMAAMQAQTRRSMAELEAVPVIPLSDVADGVYEGVQETPLVKVTVSVTVQNHAIAGIQLLRHETGRGTPAEALLEEMVRGNTSEVGVVSGATMSSKVITAAERNALAKGEQ